MSGPIRFIGGRSEIGSAARLTRSGLDDDAYDVTGPQLLTETST